MFGTITLFLSLLLLSNAELIFNGVLPYPSTAMNPTILINGGQPGLSYGPSASSLSSGSSLYSSANNYMGSSPSTVILKGSLLTPQSVQSNVYYPTMNSKSNFYSSQQLNAAISSTSNTINSAPSQTSNIYLNSKPQVSYMMAPPISQPPYNPINFGSNILNNGMNSVSSSVSASSSYIKDTSSPILSSVSSMSKPDPTISYDFSSVNIAGSSQTTQ